MIETVVTAIARKVIFMAILFGGFKFIDNFYFKAFDTDEVIKNDPLAVAIIVGAFVLALAFA